MIGTEERIAQVVQTDTRHGKMWVLRDDTGCSRLLREYGEYSETELELMKDFIGPDDTVMDIGAHIGAFTVPIARVCKKVYAVEPQAEIVEILRKNIELAGLTNVEILPYALGYGHGKVKYTPNPEFAGSVTMEDIGECEVEMYTLDELGIEPEFIKIDSEGMEIHIIAGGMDMIRRKHPYIMAERITNNMDLLNGLGMLGYINCPMALPMYTPQNWKNNPTNHYPNMAHLMNLAIPRADDGQTK